MITKMESKFINFSPKKYQSRFTLSGWIKARIITIRKVFIISAIIISYS
ncbi:MAG: hypothetical protein H6Q15_2066 [Bacteroidetes bacterium]|nr:hypothetical protein [Bacteroidota bacterium]